MSAMHGAIFDFNAAYVAALKRSVAQSVISMHGPCEE